ncbi:uncharacterized protein EAE98_009500 [Botrytis deweyae]|uniref:N-acetyltransferase domain-containing protein n=1 Tax=Botrytis deweyae TaxID=2478750 RepID=A0ABQ7IBK0_9HELO|nr:uncharacterized protein EAE98_009500 [Botrytis deweyae]KAF7919180.1 hypothetical protein EAE98_009500 [Botrytis deweyae]
MAIPSITPSSPSPKFAKVDLIPWDPDSPSHVERLFNQRVACTWNSEYVESWREKQRRGAITLQWIVLPITTVARDDLHKLHTTQFPLESEPLIDSATTFNALPRTPPSPPHSFLPIGHIALEVQPSSPISSSPSSTYKISGLYISGAMRSLGLGRATMDTIETLASSPPISAKKLLLEVIANEYPGKEERNVALKIKKQPVERQDWYARRGYRVVGMKDGMWPEKDEEGRVWTARCLFMERVVG